MNDNYESNLVEGIAVRFTGIPTRIHTVGSVHCHRAKSASHTVIIVTRSQFTTVNDYGRYCSVR